MSTPSIQVMAAPTSAPRHAAVSPGRLAGALSRFGSGVWRALETTGQRHARTELLRLANAHSHRPEFARQLRDAADRLVERGG